LKAHECTEQILFPMKSCVNDALIVWYCWADRDGMRVWDVASRKCVRTINASEGMLRFATSGQLLAVAGLSPPPSVHNSTSIMPRFC
jgi:hypothetical protein